MEIKISDIIRTLEQVAPPVYQESYDNAGLLVGNSSAACTGVITCLDSTEAVIDEAIAHGCNLIVAHHPIVFKGLKRFTGRNYVERVVMKAIKADVAIYAIHTNLDNVYAQGVNTKIAARLGLVNTRILVPKANLVRVLAKAPHGQLDEVKEALADAIESQQSLGDGLQQLTLGVRPGEGSYWQIEAVFPVGQRGAVLSTLAKFPEVAYSLDSIDNLNPLVGSGMIGELPRPLKPLSFLKQLKTKMQVGCVKYTALPEQPVQRIAICGGAGGFLLSQAIRAQADVFVTADYKYHEFFDADGKIVIADIGHFESEQFTIELLAEIISEKFGNFAVRLTETRTNPVFYL